MMNISRYKSFHECALDEWNSVAVVLAEVVNSVPPSQRPVNFLQAVLALADIAGANSRKRANLLKGAEIILSNLL